jgi:Aldo/keto reductase family
MCQADPDICQASPYAAEGVKSTIGRIWRKFDHRAAANGHHRAAACSAANGIARPRSVPRGRVAAGPDLRRLADVDPGRLAIARTVAEVARELRLSSSVVALAWLRAQGGVIPILDAQTAQQLADNLACLEVELPPRVPRGRAAARGHGPPRPGQPCRPRVPARLPGRRRLRPRRHATSSAACPTAWTFRPDDHVTADPDPGRSRSGGIRPGCQLARR